ncbi:MAG: epoxide hydrolase [Anaerolineae bacterium]|nr:epoxide hydrolase [Anaerolineae bacterium]
MTAKNQSKSQVKPFTISIPQSALDDLQERLKRTRWPDEVPESGWTMGTNLAYMKKLVDYWQNKYDWKKHEAELNRLNHFTAEVNGINVHFIHERGKGPNPTPLLLLHGWPDSFYRYHKVIPMLTDPASFGGDANQSFDVIVPSIPEFGFSERKALGTDANGDLFAKLMTDILGYQTFVTAGGDVGSPISMSLALNHADILTGIHLTDVGYPDQTTDVSTLTPPEQKFATFIQGWWMKEGAYNIIQSTKPLSLAYGVNDSPVGLAAWIMNFICIAATGEEIEKRFSRDELLTNIMIYWLTETIGSSFRIYYEIAHAAPSPNAGQRSDVPAAVTSCPWDAPLPREWAERKVNLQHFTEFPRGGHFIAWEEPELYAKDIQDFVRQLTDESSKVIA